MPGNESDARIIDSIAVSRITFAISTAFATQPKTR